MPTSKGAFESDPISEDLVARTGSARRSTTDLVLAVFTYPALPYLAEGIFKVKKKGSDRDKGRKQRGRRNDQPTVGQLATSICSKVAGSTIHILTELSANDCALWKAAREAYRAQFSTDENGDPVPGFVDLPPYPPTKGSMRRFYDRFTDEEIGAECLAALQKRFTTSSVLLAQALGALTPGDPREWAEYDPKHTVFGDGWVQARYSDRETIKLPDGRIIAPGSRAKTPQAAVVQDVTRTGADGKSQAGINFVNLQIRLLFGRFVLATASTVDSEQWAVLEAMARLVAAAGDGVHALVYDRLVTGWLVRYLMAEHGIQVLGKIAAPASRKLGNEDAEPAAPGSRKLGNENAEPADDADVYGVPAPAERAERLGLMQRVHTHAAATGIPLEKDTAALLGAEVLAGLYDETYLPPVGTTLYPTTHGFDVAHGYVFHKPMDHQNPDGTGCHHHLVIDDGALYTCEVDEFDQRLVKTGLLRCTSAQPYRTATGTWARASTYLIPCGDQLVPYTLRWQPEKDYYGPGDKRKKTCKDPAGWRLHPIPRADKEKFKPIMRDRNDAESTNAKHQRSLPTLRRDRGISPFKARQDLDYLMACLLDNADTWSRRP